MISAKKTWHKEFGCVRFEARFTHVAVPRIRCYLQSSILDVRKGQIVKMWAYSSSPLDAEATERCLLTGCHLGGSFSLHRKFITHTPRQACRIVQCHCRVVFLAIHKREGPPVLSRVKVCAHQPAAPLGLGEAGAGLDGENSGVR